MPLGGFAKFSRSFSPRPVQQKFLEMIVFMAAIDSIKFSSKTELSSQFFGRLKFSGVLKFSAGWLTEQREPSQPKSCARFRRGFGEATPYLFPLSADRARVDQARIIHSVIFHSSIHSFIDSFIHSFIHSLSHSIIHSFIFHCWLLVAGIFIQFDHSKTVGISA